MAIHFLTRLGCLEGHMLAPSQDLFEVMLGLQTLPIDTILSSLLATQRDGESQFLHKIQAAPSSFSGLSRYCLFIVFSHFKLFPLSSIDQVIKCFQRCLITT
jgi:hypothetical protein